MTGETFLPILAAGVVSAIIGLIWYHPRAFGSAWMRHSGITPDTVERGKRRMHSMAFLAFLASILAAYVMDLVGNATGVFDITGAAKLAFLMWTGFVVPALSGIVLWEQKPVTLYLINSLYWLVALVAMSVILIL